MLLAKDLLFGGVAGMTLLGSGAVGIYYTKEKIRDFMKEKVFPETPGGTLNLVGLQCIDWDRKEGGVECSKSSGSISVWVLEESGEKFEVASIPSGAGGRIWLYREGEGSEYRNNLRFSVEGGDIGGSTSGKKMEEFETYEIKEKGGRYYLFRKKKSWETKRKMLGLPENCQFPQDNNPTTTCQINDSNIDKIKFEGKGEGITLTGTMSLQISKSPSDLFFPYGYRFTLTPGSEDITISSGDNPIVFKGNVGEELKIKKSKDNKSLTLERAWNKETLTKKIKLVCNGTPSESNGINCTKAITNDNIKVKQGNDSSIEVSSIPSSGGKIRLYKAGDSDGYFKNLKFSIEVGDISGTGNSKKLEEFETYEIKKDTGENWYLTRKKKSWEEKRRLLGIPEENCDFPESSGTTTTCTLDDTKINNIKFEGKTDTPITGSASLKIEVAKSDESEYFPLGYKFTLTSTGSGNLTITRSSGNSLVLKSNQPEEFKIKKSTNHKSLTLEEAWNQETLTKKVGITCPTPSGTNGSECTKRNGNNVKIKVKKESSTFDLDNISTGKIKLYKAGDSDNYFKNLKFSIEEGDISGSGNNKLEQFETYEIKKDETSGTHYLTKKTEAKEGIKKALGLDDCQFPTNSNGQQEGCDISGDKFKKVKFDGIDSEANAKTGAKLKITSESSSQDYPFGFKFVLESANDAKISKTLTIGANTNTEFKIKKKSNSNEISLEKRWTPSELGKKIKLKDCVAKDKKCSFGENINVHDGSNGVTGAGFQNGGKDKKITYEEGQSEYNQGIKFTVEEEVNLSGGTAANGTTVNKIEKKDGDNGASYEIKEVGGNWYLYKKGNSQLSS